LTGRKNFQSRAHVLDMLVDSFLCIRVKLWKNNNLFMYDYHWSRSYNEDMVNSDLLKTFFTSLLYAVFHAEHEYEIRF
jgi:uncharacterized membrane protein